MIPVYGILPLLAIICFLVHFFVSKVKRTGKRAVELLLLYLLVVVVGGGGLYGFLGHVFFADLVAKSIGWPTGNMFQYEVGVVNLAFGLLGILCIWFRGNFWTATVTGVTVFFWGAAVGHFREAILYGNFNSGNFGPVLWLYSIPVPLVMVALLIALNVINKKTAQS
jgi:hypothetical protein